MNWGGCLFADYPSPQVESDRLTRKKGVRGMVDFERFKHRYGPKAYRSRSACTFRHNWTKRPKRKANDGRR
jgi:hypothetical protein